MLDMADAMVLRGPCRRTQKGPIRHEADVAGSTCVSARSSAPITGIIGLGESAAAVTPGSLLRGSTNASVGEIATDNTPAATRAAALAWLTTPRPRPI